MPRTNPRQRRGLGLLALAVVGALAAFASVRAYVLDVRSTVGPMVSVVQLTKDVARYEPVTADGVRVVLVPARWRPATVVGDVGAVEGLVAAADLAAGSYLQSDMVGAPPSLEPGQRSALLSLPLAAVSDDVTTGSRIDVVAALDKARTGKRTSSSRVVVNGALVLSVTRAPAAEDEASATPTTQVRLRLALSARETQVLTWAQSNSTAMSVSVVGPGSPALREADRTYNG